MINKIDLTIDSKKISLLNNKNSIKIIGMTWVDFSDLISYETRSSFELNFYYFKEIKSWSDIVEYFTYIQWHPKIKVLTKLEKRKNTKLPLGLIA
jgi:hypothetical protein